MVANTKEKNMKELRKLLMEGASLSEAEYQAAVAESQEKAISLLHALELLYPGKEKVFLEIFSRFYEIPSVDLSEKEIPLEILALLPKSVATQLRVLPIEQTGSVLRVAMGDPQKVKVLDTIGFKAGLFTRPVLASELQISHAIEKYYGAVDIASLRMEEAAEPTSSATQVRKTIGVGVGEKEERPIIQLVNDVMIQCISQGASDIHFEAYENTLRIRLRIDGALREIAHPPYAFRAALISRVKIMAGLDIAETRLPQDGAINITIGEKPIDFRVNSLPSTFGEKIVMRVLDKTNLHVDMTQLGFTPEQFKTFTHAIKNPHGMVLVTGPTGSGKTTTLYSAIQELNQEDVNIMTAEDPVEYSLQGINQIQVKPEIGLDFAAALRAFLRQDPDIILVGEIRDVETAEIAIKASLTGHLVLSTVHTNSAIDTISRLLNMGVEAYNVVAALTCITAQRLARRICTRCRVVDEDATPIVLEKLGIPSNVAAQVKAYKGKGCMACNQTGTRGRVAIHEVLELTETIKKGILSGMSSADMRKIAMKEGMRTLRQSALNQMAQGVISLAEVFSTTASEDREEEP
jgi:type IV pilus assembly protein PilB